MADTFAGFWGHSVLSHSHDTQDGKEVVEGSISTSLSDNNQKRIGTPDGMVAVQSIRCLADESQRWDKTLIAQVIGFSWQPKGTPAEKVTSAAPAPPPPAPLPFPMPIPDPTATVPRRFYVTLKDLARFAWTEGCLGCEALPDDKPQRPHSDACGNRIREKLGENDPRARQIAKRPAVTPEDDWRRSYINDLGQHAGIDVNRYIVDGHWQDDILINDHRSMGKVARTSEAMDDTEQMDKAVAVEEGMSTADGSSSSAVPARRVKPIFAQAAATPMEDDQEDVLETPRSPKRKGEQEVYMEESLLKTYRVEDKQDLKQVLYVAMNKGYNPVEDSLPEVTSLGDKVEQIDPYTIFKLDPTGQEFGEWMTAFKKEYDAYVDSNAFDAFTLQEAQQMGVREQDILPMKLVTNLPFSSRDLVTKKTQKG